MVQEYKWKWKADKTMISNKMQTKNILKNLKLIVLYFCFIQLCFTGQTTCFGVRVKIQNLVLFERLFCFTSFLSLIEVAKT